MSYDRLFEIWRRVRNSGNRIIFDFSPCTFLGQSGVAFLGGLARLLERRGHSPAGSSTPSTPSDAISRTKTASLSRSWASRPMENTSRSAKIRKLRRLLLPGCQIFPSFGFAQPAPARLRVKGSLLPAEQSERSIMKGGFLRRFFDCFAHCSPISAPQYGVIVDAITSMKVRSKRI